MASISFGCFQKSDRAKVL